MTSKDLINKFMNNLNLQDKLDINDLTREREKDKKLAIKANEKYLREMIDMYKEIYSLNEEDSINFEKEIGVKKTELLSNLEKSYIYQLDLLGRYGMNISKFPKNLEDLTK